MILQKYHPKTHSFNILLMFLIYHDNKNTRHIVFKMTIINLNELPGRFLLDKFLHYFKINGDSTKPFHVTRPEVIPSQAQRGETCKLKALADAIEHAACKADAPSVPLYKNKRHPHSLRQTAKAQGSIVGEMYSLESLLTTCQSVGYAATHYAPSNEDEYITQLETLIDENFAPMIFFDVDLEPGQRYGHPHIGTGKNEHAAVVVGYYKNQYDETHFIVAQCGRYFDFDGMELALSSCRSLATQREIETFRKVQDEHGEKKWYLKNKAHLFGAVLPRVPERVSSPMQTKDTPLKGKIMVVTEPYPSETITLMR